jgi:hypothetical protein
MFNIDFFVHFDRNDENVIGVSNKEKNLCQSLKPRL